MALLAKLYPQAEADRRDVRHSTELDATLRDAASLPVDISISDLSASGFRAVFPNMLAAGELVRIGISGIGVCEARVVWQDAQQHGCAFTTPVPYGVVAHALKADTVVHADFGTLPHHLPHTLPLDERWPGWVRLTLVITLPVLMWGGLIYAGNAVLTR